MYKTIISIALMALVASCGPTQTPQQRAKAAANKAKNDAIWSSRSATTVKGKVYEVGVAPDRSYALVAPRDSKIWITSEMVTAVQKVSGCRGKPDFLLAAALDGDLNTPIDMSKVRTNISRMRSNLEC